MYNHYAFVSESGNNAFDFNDNRTTDYFVVSAILIEAVNIADIQQKLAMQLDLLDKKSLLDQEEMIKPLLSLKLQIYAVVINKKELWKRGGHGSLDPSFDFMNKLIYQDLFLNHLNVLVHVDDRKTPFMNSLDTYINKRHQPDLFDRSEFLYEDNQKSRLMQLSHVIARLLREAFTYDKSIVNKLSSKVIRLEKHPTFNYRLETDDGADAVIARQAISAAQNYIKRYDLSEVQVNMDRVTFLKFLLTQLAIKPNTYIYGQEVIDNMNTFNKDPVSRDYLMSDIIGPLRDKGILIASTSKGYKIPTSSKDLIDYVDFSSSMALPILRRIKKGRERVLEVTNNDIDIIGGEEFMELREMLGVKYPIS